MRSSWQRRLMRLRAMSREELADRAASFARRRLGWLPWVAAAARADDAWLTRIAMDDALRAELPAYLARVLGARVYGVDWTPERLAEGLAAAGARDRIVTEADAIVGHRLRVLGYGVREAGAPIDWHRDVVAGVQWPVRSWGWMTRGFAEGWDPKIVWEPSRHQHFMVLAAAAALTREPVYADELADQLAGWIAQNPTGRGIHWVESIEPAFRVLAWIWALPVVLRSPRFTPDLCLAVLRSLVTQTRHVAANLSTYTSPNTHLTAEALALFTVGTVLPELAAAPAWRERGRAILEREAVLQVGDDGVYREASLYYHAYTVEFALLAVVIAERNGVALAPLVRARLARMLEALAWVVRPDGTLPGVGDGDGGRTLRLGAPNLAHVGELLASGAVLFGSADLRAGLAPCGEEAAWLWPDGVTRLRRLGWVAPTRGWRHFPDARLVVERRRVDGDERTVLFDAGDLGMLSGGHGHAGCLGLELYAGGRAWLVDRGTNVYNGAPAWRRYFRGTRAHSTVVVDGRDQAEPAGTFQWTTRYRSRIVRELSTPDYSLVTGEHDGYRRLPDPVTHRRTVLSVGGEYWICIDVLDAAAAHDAEFLFHFAPGLGVEADAGGAFAAAAGAVDGVCVVAAGFAAGACRVVTGATDPIQGWHSDDYGDCRPAPTLITAERVTGTAVRAHVLAPLARAARGTLTVDARHVDGGLVLTIRRGEIADLVCCSAGGARPFAAGAAEFVGALLHARVGPAGELRRFLAVEASALEWNGVSRLSTSDAADWVAKVVEPAAARTASVNGTGATGSQNRHGRAPDALVTIEGA